MFAGLRHYDRKDVEIGVTVVDDDGFAIPFETVNISESGLFIGSQYLYDIGTEHTLVLEVVGAGAIEVRARVVRVEGGNEPGGVGVSGMAYKFIETDTRTHDGLAQLVASV
jgi:Tfp pilus assembly protein PilZ